MTYELNCLDGRKSFYGKANVRVENGEKTLISYSTAVCRIDGDGNFIRLWDGWSATTARHINSFRMENGLGAISKAEWMKLDVC